MNKEEIFTRLNNEGYDIEKFNLSWEKFENMTNKELESVFFEKCQNNSIIDLENEIETSFIFLIYTHKGGSIDYLWHLGGKQAIVH